MLSSNSYFPYRTASMMFLIVWICCLPLKNGTPIAAADNSELKLSMTKRKTHEQIVLNEKTLQAILTLQESLTKYGLDIKQYDRFEIVEKHGFIGVTVLNTKLMSQFPGPLDPEARKKIGVRVIVNSEDQSLVGVISLEGAEIRKVK